MSGTHQVVVIGAGIAGLTAATECAQRGLQTALFDDGFLGGLITNVGELDGPPDIQGQAGADIASIKLGEALENGVDYQMGDVEGLIASDGLWHIEGHELSAPKIILATGAKLRQLGVQGEEKFTGRGVSQCAFCDGGLYQGQDVAIVGGGDAAFQEALHLTELCAKVTMLLRGDGPRAKQHFIDAATAKDNLHIRTQTEVLEILGSDGVDAIRTMDKATGSEETLDVAAAFIFVGLVPNTALAPETAARDSDKALIVDADMQTSAAGLYAIGAARSGYGGQIADAIADAVTAANSIAS